MIFEAIFCSQFEETNFLVYFHPKIHTFLCLKTTILGVQRHCGFHSHCIHRNLTLFSLWQWVCFTDIQSGQNLIYKVDIKRNYMCSECFLLFYFAIFLMYWCWCCLQKEKQKKSFICCLLKNSHVPLCETLWSTSVSFCSKRDSTCGGESEFVPL